MKLLDVGCGKNKVKGAIGLDNDPSVKPDVLADFDKPLPFKSGTFDKIVLNHALEHSKNFGKLLAECDRIVKQDGTIEITLPTKRSWGYYWHLHNYFFEFEGLFGRTKLPKTLQELFGKFIPNEMLIRIKKRTKKTMVIKNE